MQDFSKRFGVFMERFGPKQKDLLEKLKPYGISQANLTHWSTGKGRPNNNILAIRKAYPELNIDWFLTGEGEMLLPKQKLSPIGSDPEKDELKKQLYDALNQKNEYRDKYISLLEKVNGIDNNKR
jgi:hypothetical protein